MYKDPDAILVNLRHPRGIAEMGVTLLLWVHMEKKCLSLSLSSSMGPIETQCVIISTSRVYLLLLSFILCIGICQVIQIGWFVRASEVQQ